MLSALSERRTAVADTLWSCTLPLGLLEGWALPHSDLAWPLSPRQLPCTLQVAESDDPKIRRSTINSRPNRECSTTTCQPKTAHRFTLSSERERQFSFSPARFQNLIPPPCQHCALGHCCCYTGSPCNGSFGDHRSTRLEPSTKYWLGTCAAMGNPLLAAAV